MTSLSILIPTQGRDTLERCLDSCMTAGFMPGDDKVVVVVDAHEMNDSRGVMDAITRQLVSTIGRDSWALFQADEGHHCWGHCQLNSVLTLRSFDGDGTPYLKSDYILCQDDDDVYAAGAFDRIRAQIDALSEPSPLLFRFRSFFGMTFWDTKGKAIENHIGGHCAVFPNDERLGRFTCRYQGDFDYIRSTLDNWGGDDRAVWVDDVIAIARPAEVTV